MRPVLASIVTDYRAMTGVRRIHMIDVAIMNDLLDVRAENDRRAREAK